MFKYSIVSVFILSHLSYSASLEELDYSKEKREILGYFTPSKENSLSIQDFVEKIPSKKNGGLSINLQNQTDLGDVSIDFLREEIQERELKLHSLDLTGIPNLSLITLEAFFEEDMEIKNFRESIGDEITKSITKDATNDEIKRQIRICFADLILGDLTKSMYEEIKRKEEIETEMEKRKEIEKNREYFVDYLIKMDFSEETPLSWLKDAVLKHHLIFLNEDDLKEERLDKNEDMYFLKHSLRQAIIDTHNKYYKSLKNFVKKDKP